MLSYKNIIGWYGETIAEPQWYEQLSTPIDYRGFSIYQIDEFLFHIVRDGVCIGQYGNLSGSKSRIDSFFN